MSQQGVFTGYFHEVESWCESVLQVLDSRAMAVSYTHLRA
ncbi:superoxide dismutase, partial [Bacillus cereus]|nr:superoxide dismutase [Bacillus cereus]